MLWVTILRQRCVGIEREDAQEAGEEDGIYGEATELGVLGVGRGRWKGRCL